MRTAATIRKASAYLTSFDAPQPANDEFVSDDALASVVEDSPAILNDPTLVGDEPDQPSEGELRPPPGVLSPEALAEEVEQKIASAVDIERKAAEQRLQQAREDWTTEIADRLAHRLEQSMSQAIDRFRDDVAGILTPFISREVFSRTIEEMTASVKKGLAGAVDPAIEISGPSDVIDKLSHALANRDIAVIARESDVIDARIDFGTTTIETALEAWLTGLALSRKEER